MDIKALKNEGLSQREIARKTGHSRNTVARVLAERSPKPFAKPKRTSALDPFKDYLKARRDSIPLSSVRLLEEIRPMGYVGSIDVVRRFVKTLVREAKAAAIATVRYETPPGAQAQADWAYCGRVDGKKVYGFIMVLGFSRGAYVEFTNSMGLPDLLKCHMNAFEDFGGWPKSILYDNMKQVRLDPFRLNPLFADFANYYGFDVKTHRPYRPRTKGKVERTVNYLKDNFLLGREFADLAEMNAQGRRWLDHTANVRVHGTTGQRPCDLLEIERGHLTPVRSTTPYQVYERFNRTVDVEGYVRLDGSRYAVPVPFVGKEVIVSAGERRVVVRSQDLIVAEHDRATGRGQRVGEKEHIAEMWKATVVQSERLLCAPPPPWTQNWNDVVEVAPLSRYQEAASQ